MKKVSMADKLATIKNYRVFILNGHDLDNKECYYILACPPHKLDFIKNNDVDNLEDHAIIVDSGFGTEPNEAVKQKLKDEFDIYLDEAA